MRFNFEKPDRRDSPSVSPSPPGSSQDSNGTQTSHESFEPARDLDFDVPGVESLHGYAPGGYHPVHIGEIYFERYRVLHKLGYGAYSTVWLARDLNSVARTRYVSLKFVVSDLTGKNNEIKIHRHLASQSVRTHPGSEHVIALLDYFTVHGVNGEHDVLVFPVVGPHLGVMLEKYQDEINQSVKSLLRQIALGASFLHDCGIVHADLYTGNVALEIRDLDGEPQKNLFIALSSPECVPTLTRDPQGQGDTLPKYLVKPQSLKDLVRRENIRIKIIDFGEAFFVAEPPQHLLSPLAFRAPEGMFNRLSKSLKITYGPQVDVWSIGSLLYELATSGALINYAYDEATALRKLITLLGPMPQEWMDAVGASLSPDSSASSLEGMDGPYSGFDTKFVALLREILVFEPSQRPGALEILDHPWFGSSQPPTPPDGDVTPLFM